MKTKQNPISQKRYEQMFDSYFFMLKHINILNREPDNSAEKATIGGTKSFVKGIRKLFVTDEQRIYALKFYRLYLFRGFLPVDEWTLGGSEWELEFKEKYKKELSIIKKIQLKIREEGLKLGIDIFDPEPGEIEFGGWYSGMKHYFGEARATSNEKLLRMRFNDVPSRLKFIAGELEDEWKKKLESRNRVIDFSFLDKRESGIFLNLDVNWAWYYNKSGYCELTAKSMGHCGNADPKEGDIILNLGEKVPRGYIPHLTFILNNGVLGEMKGRHNDKPDPKYHDKIIPLILDKRIFFIAGGGYRPQNNFSLEDLSKDDLKLVLSKRPEFESIDSFIKQGSVKKLLNWIEKQIDHRAFTPFKWFDLKIEKGFVVSEPMTIKRALTALYECHEVDHPYKGRFLAFALNVIENIDHYFDFDWFDDDDYFDWSEILEEVLEQAKPVDKVILKRHMSKLNDRDVIISEELKDLIMQSYRYGFVASVENEHQEFLQKRLVKEGRTHSGFWIEPKQGWFSGEKDIVRLKCDLKTFISNMLLFIDDEDYENEETMSGYEMGDLSYDVSIGYVADILRDRLDELSKSKEKIKQMTFWEIDNRGKIHELDV